MKKALLIMLCLFIFSSTQAFANNSSNYNMSEHERYKQLGFSDEEISTMTDEVKKKLEGMTGVLVESTEKYYRVTENKNAGTFAENSIAAPTRVEITKEQAYRELAEDMAAEKSFSNPGESITSWMKMRTSVSNLGGGRYHVKNSFQWLKKPVWTLTDAVGFTYTSQVAYEAGSEFAVYNYDVYNPQGKFKETKAFPQFRTDDKHISGLGFKIDLHSDPPFFDYKNHSGYASAIVYNTNSQNRGFTVYGHYAHSEYGIIGTLILTIRNVLNFELTGVAQVDNMPSTSLTIDF